MRRLFGSLLFRIAAVLVLGLAALQAAIFLVVVWPDDRPAMFRLVDPADAREIAEAVEAAPRGQRAAIAAAASVGGTSVRLLPSMPDDAADEAGLRAAPRLDARFRAYADELRGRDLRVQVRRTRAALLAPAGSDVPAGPLRLLVRLNTGEALAIERAPLLLRQLASRYAVVAAVATLVVALLLVVLWLQVIRPLARLARDTRSLRYDGEDSDLPLSGGREMRELTVALNTMKRRIGSLVAERTAMLAAIAHDLRTYLTRLRLRTEFIADAGQRSRAEADLAEMAQLLDDILLFAAAERGRGAPVPAIDAREEVLALVDLRREAGDQIVFVDHGAPLPCRCRRLAFRRIVGNLLDNAIHYGGTATIEVRPAGAQVALRITDEGPGVPEAQIEALMQPFARLEASRGRHSGGAGLGLAIVKALAEGHGGSFALRNRAEGGLEAEVLLPGARAVEDQREAGR